MPQETDANVVDAADFYPQVLARLIAAGEIDPGDEILVVNGGEFDARVLRSHGFTNVVISNLDERIDGTSPFEHYGWSRQNTTKLTYEDASFDFVFVHAGLHHLRCPQQGILEMYRVARKGILGFEPHDCIYTRLGVWLGFGQEYETSAVYHNGCRYGGVENSNVPNFVYRFSKREIIKTVQTNNPIGDHQCTFYYQTRIPPRLRRLRNPCLRLSASVLGCTFEFIGRKLPMFANNIGFFIRKPVPKLFPWLERDQVGGVRPLVSYLETVYLPSSGSGAEA
jgi:SAM-dependent methyltransferase